MRGAVSSAGTTAHFPGTDRSARRLIPAHRLLPGTPARSFPGPIPLLSRSPPAPRPLRGARWRQPRARIRGAAAPPAGRPSTPARPAAPPAAAALGRSRAAAAGRGGSGPWETRAGRRRGKAARSSLADFGVKPIRAFGGGGGGDLGVWGERRRAWTHAPTRVRAHPSTHTHFKYPPPPQRGARWQSAYFKPWVLNTPPPPQREQLHV